MKPFQLQPMAKAKLTRVKNATRFPNIFGATFNRDGSVFRGRFGDVITLVSRNVAAHRLNPAMLARFSERYPEAKIGVFRLEKKPGFISMDANVIRSAKFRAQNLEMARQTKQEAIFDLTRGEVVRV